MVCSHCKESGHNFKTCPTITPEEKEAIIKKNKEIKEQRIRRRLIREQREREAVENMKIKYEIINCNEYEVVLYWGEKDSNEYNRFMYINPHETSDMYCLNKHRIIMFPFLEVTNGTVDAPKTIKKEDVNSFVNVFDFEMKNYNETTIILQKNYKPKKTELDLWKEVGLKSKYLLDQVIKLGGMKNDNLEPILDLVQYIEVPLHSEVDKEKAGIPSTLTNIT